VVNPLLPFSPVGSVDDLLERAQRGVNAGSALDTVKDRLTLLRDALYRALLNASAEKVLEIRADLKAIEKLAQALLVDEAQGQLAYDELLKVSGINKPEPEKFLAPSRVARKRPSRSRAGTAK